MTTAPSPPRVRKRWQVRDVPATVPQGDWPALIGTLLAHRGLHDADAARAFLDCASDGPPELPDLAPAVERLAGACHAGETVAVFGDFDVDGVTATALLTESLASLGARPIPYLPHRLDEGYGLNTDAIASLHRLGATLLITADCGTSSIDEIAFARRQEMDVIVLDHHSVPEHLPLGALIVNPKRIDGARDEPSAGGVAYYVLRALHNALGREPDDAAMLQLVALSTVCDMAPLSGDNRRLVRSGLDAMTRSERPGLRALIEIAGANAERLDTEAIAFSLGPRLNAAGRMAHARLAFDLLTTRDDDRAVELAAELDGLNRQRQRATEEAVALAEELVAQEGDVSLLMVGDASFSPGIVGLIAARLVEAHQRPAIVYERGEQESRASARSIKGFDVTNALRLRSDLFVRYGGHRMAAGFTATNENLPAIKEHLLAHAADELRGRELSPSIEIDAQLPLASLRGEEIRWLGRLAPYGVGNPEPAFLSRDVLIVERKAVGEDGRHLRLKLRDGAVSWPAIAFRQEGEGIEKGARADVVYTLSADRRSSDRLELRVLDLRPAE